MKIAIMQPYLFPYIGYFQLVNHVDTFILFDDVNYIKKGYINRNNYLINGNKKTLTIPVLKASQNKKINQLSFSHETDVFLKNIYFNYKSSKYFSKIYPIIEKTLKTENKSIENICKISIELILEYLEIRKKIILSSSINYSRNNCSTDKIISICHKLNANHYINPIGGLDIYNKNIFSNENIKISFLKTNFMQYEQNTDKFLPALSIIDILMKCDKGWILKHLSSFDLI